MTDTAPTVLFICQHNAGRSQLGAALLEHLAGDRFTATSAGLSPANEVNPAVAATVAELGIDITIEIVEHSVCKGGKATSRLDTPQQAVATVVRQQSQTDYQVWGLGSSSEGVNHRV